MEDPIVEEVRRIREEHAASFNYDIDAIYADLKRFEAESKLPHVSLEPRWLSTRTASRVIPPITASK
jgi:hypothetical protein